MLEIHNVCFPLYRDEHVEMDLIADGDKVVLTVTTELLPGKAQETIVSRPMTRAAARLVSDAIRRAVQDDSPAGSETRPSEPTVSAARKLDE